MRRKGENEEKKKPKKRRRRIKKEEGDDKKNKKKRRRRREKKRGRGDGEREIQEEKAEAVRHPCRAESLTACPQKAISETSGHLPEPVLSDRQVETHHLSNSA